MLLSVDTSFPPPASAKRYERIKPAGTGKTRRKRVEKHSQRKKGKKKKKNRAKEHKRRYDPRINHKRTPENIAKPVSCRSRDGGKWK
jgi:hypothetical protein